MAKHGSKCLVSPAPGVRYCWVSGGLLGRWSSIGPSHWKGEGFPEIGGGEREGGGGAGPSSPISERMGSKTLVWVTVRKRSVLNLPPSAVLLLELVAG